MLRYFLHVLTIAGALILLSGCKGNPDGVEQAADADTLEDALAEDSAEERAAHHESARPDASEGSAADRTRRARTRGAGERQSRGPRKIQRPTAATRRPDPEADASEAHEEPSDASPAATAPPSPQSHFGSATKPRASASGETQAVDSDADNEEEAARHFSFDGSDEELDMILGLREIPPFRIDDLLTVADLREGLGPHTPAAVGQLQGQAATPFYNNLWFKSQHDGQLGVVLQYWYFQTPKAAQIHYEMLEKTALSEPKPVGIGSEAYYIDLDGSITLVALQVTNHAVTSLTCDIQNCFIPQLMRWTTLIHERAAQSTSSSNTSP